MSEGARLVIWLIIVVLDLYMFLDYEWHKKEVKYDKSRKSRKKSRNSSSGKGRNDHLSLIWNDLDNIYGDHR